MPDVAQFAVRPASLPLPSCQHDVVTVESVRPPAAWLRAGRAGPSPRRSTSKEWFARDDRSTRGNLSPPSSRCDQHACSRQFLAAHHRKQRAPDLTCPLPASTRPSIISSCGRNGTNGRSAAGGSLRPTTNASTTPENLFPGGGPLRRTAVPRRTAGWLGMTLPVVPH